MRHTLDSHRWWRRASRSISRLLARRRRSTPAGLADEAEWTEAIWLAVFIAMIGLCLGSVFTLSPHAVF